MHTRQLLPQQASFRLGRTLRLAAALTCVGAGFQASALAADEASESAPGAKATSSQSGRLEGRVYNAASGAYLNNARVTVEGTTIEAFTDESGTYRLREVPAGDVRLKVSFTGQSDIFQTVAVASGVINRANITFNTDNVGADAAEIVLDPFEVKSSHFRNAVEIALNEERAALNIKSVVAVDSLGYVADGNVGDFVRFLPGVDIEYGDGTAANPDNAVSVGVRGFGADSTAILIDGVPVASGSPSGLSRTVQLDGLSINNVSRLEVIKVATPDMPQDSPGGAINLISRSAFELPRATFDLSVAFNANTNDMEVFKRTPGPNSDKIFKTLPNIRFGGSIPLSDKLGVTFSVASDNKYSLTGYSRMRDWFYYGRNSAGSGSNQPVSNANGGIRIDNPVIDRFELKEYQWVENRLSGSLGLDWRPIEGLDIKLTSNFNTYENTGVTYRSQWRYRNATGIKDWGDDYVEGFQRTPTFNPNLQGSMTVDARDKEGFTSQGSINVKFRRNGWNINARATASESFTSFPDRKNGHFSTIDASISPGRMDLVDIKDGVIGEILLWDSAGNPLDYGKLENWNQFTSTGGIARSSEAYNRDLVKQYNLDIARDLDFMPFPMTVKIGGQEKSKSQHKWGAGSSYRMMYVGPVVPNSELQSDYATASGLGYSGNMYWADPSKIYQLYEANPEYFDDQIVSAQYNTDLRANNYESRVNNTKGLTVTNTDIYGMLTAKLFSNRLTVVTGARQSRAATKGYNVFNNPKFNYVTMPDGTIYRDSQYPAGVKFDGSNNAGGVARDIVLTDQALRSRMTAAGVDYLPGQLELSPNGLQNGSRSNNYFLAQRARYTREIDTSLTQPWTPQVQVAYDITDQLRAQVSWSRETRLPDLEGSNGVLVGGSSFQVSEANEPTLDLGGDGSITIANLKNEPEINNSYNAKLAYYPKNGLGRYSISYYYKIVDNAWQSVETYNTDADYDSLLASMGLDRDSYENYRISTVTATGIEQIRKGFEIELNQNLGLFGDWGRPFDTFVTYTRRPVTVSTGGENRLGWIPLLPVRAKWSAGVSYSKRRFTAQARMTWIESGITYSGSNTSVDLPDGTRANIQLYNLNIMPPELKLDLNYALSERFTIFANGNKVLSGKTYERTSDEQTGYMPDYATYRTMNGRGVTVTAGVRASF